MLPPSEGKTPAASGEPLHLAELHFPALTRPRRRVLSVLAKVSAHEDALATLGVGASLAATVERNIALLSEPAAPAHRIYTGVLYDALGYATLSTAQQRKANSSVLVASALWGAIGLADVVPAYRLSMSVSLPSLGRLAAFWKPWLAEVLNARADGELVIDCRSGPYAAAWPGPAAHTVCVNVFRQRDGKRTVVSHMAKHTRGELTRHLLTRAGHAPKTPSALLAAAQEKWPAELIAGTARKAHALNIVLTD